MDLPHQSRTPIPPPSKSPSFKSQSSHPGSASKPTAATTPKCDVKEQSRRAEASIGVVGNYLADLNHENLPLHFKDEHDDLAVVYNPAVPRNLSLDNVCSVSSQSVVCSICFNPDDKFVAFGCNQEAKIFQALTGLAEATLRHDWDNEEGHMFV